MKPHFHQLDESCISKRIALRYCPGTPPTFPNGEPTPRDVAAARRMFVELDRATQAWYAYNTLMFRDLFEIPPGAASDRDYLASLRD